MVKIMRKSSNPIDSGKEPEQVGDGFPFQDFYLRIQHFVLRVGYADGNVVCLFFFFHIILFFQAETIFRRSENIRSLKICGAFRFPESEIAVDAFCEPWYAARKGK